MYSSQDGGGQSPMYVEVCPPFCKTTLKFQRRTAPINICATGDSLTFNFLWKSAVTQFCLAFLYDHWTDVLVALVSALYPCWSVSAVWRLYATFIHAWRVYAAFANREYLTPLIRSPSSKMSSISEFKYEVESCRRPSSGPHKWNKGLQSQHIFDSDWHVDCEFRDYVPGFIKNCRKRNLYHLNIVQANAVSVRFLRASSCYGLFLVTSCNWLHSTTWLGRN